ncbi:NUDIX hydrolase [Calothrix sp. PCC 6303]|uniref:NUDIX hydrolase n=1 Tax=Calothrix sp. PCC 6303 TaxID=1170562 RepID=UPI0002A04A6E|nr:NUDIX hydrolase [Calothrix sp. PCC 6303]AFY99830.1 NUDIX hydrolase [Calothrix sp. PCC 6303]
MKQKINKILSQSGVIPYRIINGNVEVLLITSRERQNWVVPKGGVVRGMSPADSAAKEAWEEAGVIGKVHQEEFASYNYCKNGKTYCVVMYPLSVEYISEHYPEAKLRQRQWVDVNTAIDTVKPVLRGVFRQFGEMNLPSSCGEGKEEERGIWKWLKHLFD